MKNILYIDDNKNNVSLMQSVVENIDSDVSFYGTSSIEDFLNKAGDRDNLYIIDFTLEGILGDSLYEELLEIHNEARAIIISAGYISDLQDIFLRFEHKPIAVTDRFGAIEYLRKELTEQS